MFTFLFRHIQLHLVTNHTHPQRTISATAIVEKVRYSFDPRELAMSPPPDEFASDTEERYSRYYDNFRRHRRVLRECREVCTPVIKARSNYTHIANSRKSLVHVPSHRYLYCGIPKCGVSRWRRLARRLAGDVNWADQNAHNPNVNGLRYVRVSLSDGQRWSDTERGCG